LLIKVLVAAGLPSVDVRDVLQAHRRHLIEAMQRLTRVKAGAPPEDVALSLVVDAEIFRLEAMVRWLDAADARSKKHRPKAPRATPSSAPAPRKARAHR